VVEAPGVEATELSGVPAFAEVVKSAEGPAPIADVAAVGRTARAVRWWGAGAGRDRSRCGRREDHASYVQAWLHHPRF